MAKISTKKQTETQANDCNIHNELIEAFIKRGNLTAFKILFFVARNKIKPTSDAIQITINTKQICEYCKIDIKTLKRNVKQMSETSISIKDEKSESYITVLPYAKFEYNGTLVIKMFKEILELINTTERYFTIIDASKVMKLTSKHSIRTLMLLEYINGFDYVKRKHYTLQELNLMFGTDYKKYTDFERSILRPAKEELDKTSKLSFTYRVDKDKEHATVGRAKAVGIFIEPIYTNAIQKKLF